LDIEFMKRLHNKVNIVPVIAKADTLTHDECTKFKKQVKKYIFFIIFTTLMRVNPCLVIARMYYTVKPPVATTCRKRPPLLSDQFSKIPKVSKSNSYIWNLLQAIISL